MGITVQHDVPAGLVVQAGTLGGAGQLAAEYRKRMEAFQLQANSINAQKQMQQASIQAQAATQARQIEAQQSQMQMGHELSIDTMAKQLANQQTLQEQAHEYGLEDMQVKQDMFEEQYTWKQQQEKENIQNVKNNVMTDPSYGEPGMMTPQRQQAIWDLDRADANIAPSMRPKQVPIKIEDELANRMHVLDDGTKVLMEPDGSFKTVLPPKDTANDLALKQAAAEQKMKIEEAKAAAKVKSENARVAADIIKNAIANPELKDIPSYQWALDFYAKNYSSDSGNHAAPPEAQYASPFAISFEKDTQRSVQVAPPMNQIKPWASSEPPQQATPGAPGVSQGPAPESYPEITSEKDYDRLPAGFLYRKNGILKRKK